jgi:hypothetical protein
MSSPDPRTRTIPARPPDGWILGYSHYRSYFLFGATGIFMAIACIILLVGISALGRGEEAWSAYLTMLGSPLMLLVNSIVLAFTIYFALRFGWVGRKIPAGGKLGPIPMAPGVPMPLLGTAPIAASVAMWIVVLLILGGAFS